MDRKKIILFLLFSLIFVYICDCIQTSEKFLNAVNGNGTSQPLEGTMVFGLGYSKTGTTSLAKALNILGLKTAHTPMDFIEECLDEDLQFNPEKTKAYFEKKDIQATTDLPIPPFYKELNSLYPNAKFILTTRDISEWKPSARKQMGGKTSHDTLVTQRLLAYGADHYKEPEFPDSFLRHNEGVKKFFPKDKLLVWDLTKDPGWEPLCNFLGVPIPDKEFPHSLPGR